MCPVCYNIRSNLSCFFITGPNINVMVRSDTDVLGHSSLLRSISAPSGVDIFQDDTALDLIKLHRSVFVS